MRSEFVFNWNSKSGDNVEVIFIGLGKLVPSIIGDYIKVALQRGLFADAILIMCPQGNFDNFKGELENVRYAPLRELARASSRSVLLLSPYDECGRVKPPTTLGESNSRAFCLSEDEVEELLKSGIEAIFRNDKGLIKAPPGYGFSKPSKSGATHFIRAEDALDDVGVVDFLAFNVLRSIPKPQCLEQIFVDSMAISSIAYALREMLQRNFSISCGIRSFHSYEAIKTVPQLDRNTSLCIISASTSMGLHSDWLAQTGCDVKDTVTLLSFDDQKSNAKILHKFRKPKDWNGDIGLSSSIKFIRVLGERFSPESISPKVVELNLKHHSDGVLKRLQGNDYLLSKATKVLRQRSHNARVRTLDVDFKVLSKSPRFKEWLQRELRVTVPASIQGILFQDDVASRMLAATCSKYLTNTLGLTLTFGVHPFSEKLDKTSLDKDRALLIVASVIGSGSMLLSISRELRNDHLGAKIYLAGSQIDRSKAAADFLVKNLTQTKDGSNKVCVFAQIAVGNSLQESFRSESSLYKKMASFQKAFPDRGKQLSGKSAGLLGEALLPKIQSDGNSLPLQLNKDFVFWEPGYQPGPDHTPAVLLTVGSVLQRAREYTHEPSYSLSTEVLQHVVLNPNVFARFNDGVIQASLLRQAMPSELDYSLMDDFSQYVFKLVLDLVQKRYKNQGESVLEFALALKLERLRISREVAPQN
jgi:hypothetical protein